MKYRMYLLHIGDLEDQSLQETAVALIDDCRQESVRKIKKERDRMRAIAAGLLLQAGFAEWEMDAPYGGIMQTDIPSDAEKLSGICYKLSCKELLKYVQEQGRLPLVYEIGEHGKPYWKRQVLMPLYPDKQLWHFNLSHSEEYVVLLTADCEVGVDIQKARKADKFPGGYQAFSRMEAYVKCTGEGYAAGYKMYEQCRGEVPGYRIVSLRGIVGYAWHMCFADL